VEGRNVRLDLQFTSLDGLGVAATQLVASSPDVIVGFANPAVAALQQATRMLPIVFVQVSDPVAGNFVAGLSLLADWLRPRGGEPAQARRHGEVTDGDVNPVGSVFKHCGDDGHMAQPLSPAGQALFGSGSAYMGLGDLLRDQVTDAAEELKKKRQAQLAGRPDSAGLGYGVGGPVSLLFGGRP
jgi:hypothetical protein